MDNIEKFLVIVASFFIALFAILLLRPLATKINLLDKPSSRKNHKGNIPLIGGLSIYLCLLVIFYWLPVKNNAYLVAATLIVGCGVIDDYKDLKHTIRLVIEIIAAWILVQWGGVEITHIGNLFAFGEIQLGGFSTIFTIFAIVGGINAFNMLDGIDGLAGGLSLIVFCLLFVISAEIPEILTLCTVFIPAICAFLLFNARLFGNEKASIFLGDAGSMLFGFTITYLAIVASQGEHKVIHPTTVLWLIAIPLFDSISIMIRRIAKGKSPFSPDREHFHHILTLAGYTVNQSLSIILTLSFCLGSLGILANIVLNQPEWKMFYLVMCFFFLYYWGMSHAWTVMKVARYLREKNTDRRKEERRKDNMPFTGNDRRATAERRDGIDRRYHHIDRALAKIQVKHHQNEEEQTTKKI